MENHVLQHKLSAHEKALFVHAHERLVVLGAGSGSLRVRSVDDLMTRLCGISCGDLLAVGGL